MSQSTGEWPVGYRTLVTGTLRQLSPLSVGGDAAEPGGVDQTAFRDGSGRLAIPGSGLAGALVETLSRLFPDEADQQSDWFRRISGKHTSGADDLLESAWRVRSSRLADGNNAVECRQGVGIRQATGASASESGALFDFEIVPAGSCWMFFLEIDTWRGGAEVEAAAFLALGEWSQQRCWLGGGAARGLGWMELVADSIDVLRLPMVPDVVAEWPDNSRTPLDAWDHLAALDGVDRIGGADRIQQEARAVFAELPDTGCWYVVIDASLEPGAGEYGWDAVSISGHASGPVANLQERLIAPAGETAKSYRDRFKPDHMVASTRRVSTDGVPVLPGSSLRGPLRHAVSKFWRGRGEEIVDPNQGGRSRVSENPDRVARLFGLDSRSGRLLVRDALPAEGTSPRLAWLQQHAEDEFTGGVFGSAKFDRVAVMSGRFETRLVIEARSMEELQPLCETLAPGLSLASAGFVPLGGGKWRGLGWVDWKWSRLQVIQAGREAAVDILIEDLELDLMGHIARILEETA